jgi:hypothetical protein
MFHILGFHMATRKRVKQGRSKRELSTSTCACLYQREYILEGKSQKRSQSPYTQTIDLSRVTIQT